MLGSVWMEMGGGSALGEGSKGRGGKRALTSLYTQAGPSQRATVLKRTAG